MDWQDYRISKLRDYLFDIINILTTNRKYQINADFLGKKDDFSLDKIPTMSEIESYVAGGSLCKDVYSFRSRKSYSQDIINNLKNIGFFEQFEKIIKSNNDEGILPDIDNIEKIECLNCGTLNSVDGTEAIFNIQIKIEYEDDGEYNPVISL